MKYLNLVVLMLLFTTSSFSHGAENFGEDMARALIIRQLINSTDTKPTDELATQNSYRLCIFNDNEQYQQLNKHLKEVTVKESHLEILNVNFYKQLTPCNAIYVSEPSQFDLDILKSDSMSNVLWIVNGKNTVTKGFHVGLYLNNNNHFEFEINPESMIKSQLIPQPQLLTLARIVKNKLPKKIKILKTLIDYTNWQEDAELPKERNLFHFCTVNNPSLGTFIEYYANTKKFKGKPLAHLDIAAVEQIKNCDALLLSDINEPLTKKILRTNQHEKKLLIGNKPKLVEKGVHYSFVNDGSAAFEINLMAFERTKHTPHYELLNSAKIIERDFFSISQLISSIVNDTFWHTSKKLNSANLCVFENKNIFNQLSFFTFEKKENKKADIKIKIIDDESQFDNCHLVVADKKQNTVFNKVKLLKKQNDLLLVSIQKEQKETGSHYQVLTTPKNIKLQLNIKQLKANNFVPSKALLNLGSIFNGANQ